MRKLFPTLALLLFPATAFAADEFFYQTTWVIICIYAAAKVLGVLSEKIGIPALVGEIFGGIVLGNLTLLGMDFEFTRVIADSQFFRYAAELGIIFLLFLVGLESNLGDLLKAGFNSTVTAFVGVIVPTLSGYFFARLMGLGDGNQAMLVGATFAATSVGITAKLLTEAQKLKTPSAQVILGAAVIDDILGLILLAVLADLVTSGQFQVAGLGLILVKIAVFFAAAFVLSRFVLPKTFHLYPKLQQPGLLTAIAVLLTLLFANLSLLAGLAPIIGAFTAGLLLDEVRLKRSAGLSNHNVETVIKPITDFLLPIFFVSIGVQIRLEVLFDPKTVLIILFLTALALAGKIVSGVFCRGGKLDRLGIGLGMVPRGEVGLIFASFGLSRGIIDNGLYSILVFVVLLTTVLGPILLKTRVSRF